MDEQSPGPKWSRLDWWFRNRQTGQVTVAQFPNIPLWIFLVTIVLRRLVTEASVARTAVNLVGMGALCWWALDEVLRGVNPWRRLLGVGGLAIAAAGLASGP